jgi:spore photoproduct lyase
MQEKLSHPVSPRKIYLDRNVRRSEYVERLLKNFSALPVHIIDDPQDAGHPEALFITNFDGRFLKPCPGTKNYICCDYWILNFATGCLLDCSYCILHSYLNAPTMRLYANIDRMKEEIRQTVEGEGRKGRIFRIGTGELTDSLLLDDNIRFSENMIRYLLRFDNVVVELKTKTLNIDSVKRLGAHPNLVVSWSLNSPEMARLYESKSPAVERRIEAASHLERVGFRIGIHFDPMIYAPGWDSQYAETLDLMRDKLKNPAWVSLGAFRGPQGLKKMIGRNNPRSPLLLEELITGADGKIRYFRPIRTRMYKFMQERLAEDFPKTPVYLCMESPRVWKSVFGWAPKSNTELGDWLAGCEPG